MERFEEPDTPKVSLPIHWASAHKCKRKPMREHGIAHFVEGRFAPKLMPKREVRELMSELNELEEKRRSAIANQRIPDWARGMSLQGRGSRLDMRGLNEGSPILSRHLAALSL
jgi:hypothetical protein